MSTNLWSCEASLLRKSSFAPNITILTRIDNRLLMMIATLIWPIYRTIWWLIRLVRALQSYMIVVASPSHFWKYIMLYSGNDVTTPILLLELRPDSIVVLHSTRMTRYGKILGSIPSLGTYHRFLVVFDSFWHISSKWTNPFVGITRKLIEHSILRAMVPPMFDLVHNWRNCGELCMGRMPISNNIFQLGIERYGNTQLLPGEQRAYTSNSRVLSRTTNDFVNEQFIGAPCR